MRIDRIQNQLVYSTIRIIAGNEKPESIGTGFFVTEMPVTDNIPLLITNNHVVKDFNAAEFMFCARSKEGTPIDDKHVIIKVEDLQSRVIHHPDPSVDLCGIVLEDVVQHAISEEKAPYYICIGTDFFITDEILDSLSAIENVIMIGYPEGLIDETNNKPVTRKGITATCLDLDYGGRKEYMIDMAVFHGSSGSPVFVETTGLSQRNIENAIQLGVNTDYCFAGVVYAVPQKTVEGELKVVEAPTSKKIVSEAELMTNLGFVIKAERVNELINVTKIRLPVTMKEL